MQKYIFMFNIALEWRQIAGVNLGLLSQISIYLELLRVAR